MECAFLLVKAVLFENINHDLTKLIESETKDMSVNQSIWYGIIRCNLFIYYLFISICIYYYLFSKSFGGWGAYIETTNDALYYFVTSQPCIRQMFSYACYNFFFFVRRAFSGFQSYISLFFLVLHSLIFI